MNMNIRFGNNMRTYIFMFRVRMISAFPRWFYFVCKHTSRYAESQAIDIYVPLSKRSAHMFFSLPFVLIIKYPCLRCVRHTTQHLKFVHATAAATRISRFQMAVSFAEFVHTMLPIKLYPTDIHTIHITGIMSR